MVNYRGLPLVGHKRAHSARLYFVETVVFREYSPALIVEVAVPVASM